MSEWKEDLHPRNKHGEFGSSTWVGKLSDKVGKDIGQKPLEGEAAFKAAMPAYESPVFHDKTVRHYVGKDGYKSINGFNRHGPESQPADKHKALADHTAKLDAMIASAPPLKEPISVVRGVKNVDELFGAEGSRVGHTFSDKGFVSTSTDVRKAHRFHGTTGAQIHIHVPAGNKVLKMLLTPDDDDSEKEILLARGSKFKVLSDKYHDDYDFRVIHVELVK